MRFDLKKTIYLCEMSCFLEILKCILCCEEDSYDDTYSRTRSRPFLLESGSERNEYLVRNSYPTPTPTTTTPLYRDHYQILAKSSLPSASSPYYQTKVAIDSWISSSVTPQSSSSSKPNPSSYVPPQFSTNEVSHSSKSSSPLPPAFSSRSIQSPSKQSAYSYLSQSSPKPPPSPSSSSPSSLKPPVPSSKAPSASSPTSYKPSQSSPSTSKQPPDFKPILHIAPNNVTDEERKTSYICEKGTAIYAVPEDIKGQIKRDMCLKI